MFRVVVAAILIVGSACRDRASPPPSSTTPAVADVVPDDEAPVATVVTSDVIRQLDGDIQVREVTLARSGVPMMIKIYRSTKSAGPRPVIVIAGAGTPLFLGTTLEDGDQPEHVPWAARGYVVVAYSLDGPVADESDRSQLRAGARAFLAAHAGLDNARAALSFALEHEPALDSHQIFAVGHSSAATLALRFGAEDPRVNAIVAFNPITDVDGWIKEPTLKYLERLVPGARQILDASAPMSHATELRTKAVLLFHSLEDQNVSVDEPRRLAAAMEPADAASRLEIVPHGDHYASMIEQGIPLAIDWADNLVAQRRPGGVVDPARE